MSDSIPVNGSVHRLTQALNDLTKTGSPTARYNVSNDVYIVYNYDLADEERGADLVEKVDRGPIYYVEGYGSFIDPDHPTLLTEVKYMYGGATVEEVRDNPDEYEWGDQFYYHPNVIRIFGSWAE
tara:strand:- start:195 stop:569 length:375 start_codon:yes stop_codon:yes gene_type:complete